MDPAACLDRAAALISEEDYPEAVFGLADYSAWRFKGGFEPPGGDARHAALWERLRALTGVED